MFLILQLAGAVFKMLVPLVKYAKPGEICAAPHDFASVAVQLLHVPAMREDAGNLLHTITHIKLPDDFFARPVGHPVQA